MAAPLLFTFQARLARGQKRDRVTLTKIAPASGGRGGTYQCDMNFHLKSMKSRVAERGQVTIPKALRDRLGDLPGTTGAWSR
jgi:hypothetical protein